MALFLSNTDIALRAVEPEDLEFLYACENDTDIWHISNTLAPYSKYVLKQYIGNSNLDIYTNKQLRLIITLADKTTEPIGAIDLFDFDPYHLRAGIGILIHKNAHRKKGYASMALQLLITYCFEHLHLHQVYCNIAAANTESIGLFEKAGFIKQGQKVGWLKLADGWEDEYFYQLINPKHL